MDLLVEDNLLADNECAQLAVILEVVLVAEVVASFLAPLILVAFDYREVEEALTEVAFRVAQTAQVDLASSASEVFVLLAGPLVPWDILDSWLI